MAESLEERRSEVRGKAMVAVEILHKSLAGTMTQTRDYTDAGILIEKLPGMESLQTGMEVEVKITGIMGQEPVIKSARVVRLDEKGVALHFNEPLQSGE
jgi:hypothetical protein